MIVVRTEFRLKFGRAKEARSLIKEAIALNQKLGVKSSRALMDFTGPSYTMVFETSHESLSDFESKLQSIFGSKEWAAMYEKLIPLCESARREIYTVVE